MKAVISKLFATLLIITCLNCSAEKSEAEFRNLRHAMVYNQIQMRGVSSKPVLKAMRKVKRHKFVLPKFVNYAYADTPLPIENDQTISQPYIVALMTQLLQLKPEDTVLEIGTGSGYQAAVLAELCKKVYTIEIVENLGKKAQKLLHELGYKNIYTKIGDGYKGWPEHQPFNAIIVTCAPTAIPSPLKEQLAEDGRMVIPVGPSHSQSLVLLIKKNGKLIKSNIIPVRFVPMVDQKQQIY